MSLLLPKGQLEQVDTEDPEELLKLLAHDKHQMLEGIIVEGLFKKYLQYLESEGISVLYVDLVKAKQKNDGKQRNPAWWIWDRGNNGLLVSRIARKIGSSPQIAVLKCRYDDEFRDFYFAELYGDSRPEETVQQYMIRKRGFSTPLRFQESTENIRDPSRRSQAFWGGIHGIFGQSLFRKVVLQRLFKNFVIQPFFSYVWDIDNLVLMPDGQILQLEVKHKYPFSVGNGQLCFGINNGQINVIADLNRAGIDTLHMILVKPYWNRQKDPSYLLQDPTVRKNVLFIACYMDAKQIRKIKSSITSSSPERTSYTGVNRLNFKRIPVENFSVIGTLQDDPEELAKNIRRAAQGENLEPVTAEFLKSYKLME